MRRPRISGWDSNLDRADCRAVYTGSSDCPGSVTVHTLGTCDVNYAGFDRGNVRKVKLEV